MARVVTGLLLVLAVAFVASAVIANALLDTSDVIHDAGFWGVFAAVGWATFMVFASWRWGRD